MSTRPDLLPPLVEPSVFDVPPPISPSIGRGGSPMDDPRRFAEEQMRALVRQVFCPGWPRPARQIVISGVDDDGDVATICMQAGHALSEQVEASIGIVEVNLHDAEIEEYLDRGDKENSRTHNAYGSIRANAHQVSTNLWHVSSGAFMAAQNGLSAAWLRGRLADLRLEFDYAVLHGSPAGVFSEATLLGNLTDGVVLVLEANSTRRVVAQKTRDALHAANVRILGAVLNDRTFPIPQRIYERL